MYLENIPKVRQLANNQYIIYQGNRTIFQSYNSIIAVKDRKGKITLGRFWDYSVTTGKYRNQFLNETIKETREKIKSGEYKLTQKF